MFHATIKNEQTLKQKTVPADCRTDPENQRQSGYSTRRNPPLMPCFYPLLGYRPLVAGEKVHFKRTANSGELIQLPCGQCIGCRMERSQAWAVRIMHEAQMHDDNMFITCSYNDDKLPDDGSLNKVHFQKFMKRLRKKIEPKKIRFFHCGEYGDETRRPHYHAAIFGFWPSDYKFLKFNDQGDKIWTSEFLDETWEHGYVWLEELNFKSAAYIARYIFKKVTGEKAEEHYETVSRYGELVSLQPEYITMSNRPGIGANWLEKFHSDVFPCDFVALPDGGTAKVPGYYFAKMAEKFPEQWERVKAKRKADFEKKKSDNTFRRLEAKEKVLKSKVATFLKRKL